MKDYNHGLLDIQQTVMACVVGIVYANIVKLMITPKNIVTLIKINITRHHQTILVDGQPYDVARKMDATIKLFGLTLWQKHTKLNAGYARTALNEAKSNIGFIKQNNEKYNDSSEKET